MDLKIKKKKWFWIKIDFVLKFRKIGENIYNLKNMRITKNIVFKVKKKSSISSPFSTLVPYLLILSFPNKLT
jgi:hypothetical protein